MYTRTRRFVDAIAYCEWRRRATTPAVPDWTLQVHPRAGGEHHRVAGD